VSACRSTSGSTSASRPSSPARRGSSTSTWTTSASTGPPAAALYGDLRAALAALAEAVRDVRAPAAWGGARGRGPGTPLRQRATSRWPRQAARRCTPRASWPRSSASADPDAILVGDGGDFVSFAGRLIHRRRPGLWIDGGPFGCLGSGPGYALAAKLAHPDRQVVLLAGDGAFGFSAMEFDTLVRHRLPVVCVIGNNGIWGLEKHPMQRLLGTSILTDLAPGTRYDSGRGGAGRARRAGRSGRRTSRRPWQRAFRSGLPACVNVLCDPTAEYPRSSVLM